MVLKGCSGLNIKDGMESAWSSERWWAPTLSTPGEGTDYRTDSKVIQNTDWPGPRTG